jgi:hypothetical protein
MPVSVAVLEANERVLDGGEAEVVEAVKPRGRADGMLRRLHGCVVERSATVVGKVDTPLEHALHERRSVVRVEASEMDPGRQDEDVPREAMSALVRRHPELVLVGFRCQRAEDGGAEQRAALVATPVAANEDEPPLNESAALEIRVREIFVTLDLDPTQLG